MTGPTRWGNFARLVPAAAAALGLVLCLADFAWADYEAGLAAFERDDHAAALREFQRAADAGHPDAAFRLGEMYLHGMGVRRDIFRGLYWWERAAELGQTSAMLHLGFTRRWEFEHPPGGPYDRVKDLEEMAVEGQDGAMFSLGHHFAEGGDVPRDYALARLWWEKAAELGGWQSSYALGVLYATGQGVAKDEARARQWYEKVARQGHSRAMYELGRLLAGGRGGPQDYAEAHMWWTKAAAEGEAPAMFRLGELYAEGRGVPEDSGITRRWHYEAAERGYVPAMMSLGSSAQKSAEFWESEGMNLKQGKEKQQVFDSAGFHLMEAYKWYDRAARFGDTRAAARRDHVAAKLSPKQIKEARAWAKNWWPRLLLDRH